MTLKISYSMPRIRLAEPSEVTAIRRLVERAYAKYVPRIGRRPSPMDDDYEALIAAGEVFVVAEGAIVGVIVLRSTGEYLLVDNVAVEPLCQGKGIGRSLLAYAEQVAAQRQLRELRLYTNRAMTENIVFYQRLGWEETGRRTEDGFARVHFRKSVPGIHPSR
jgi:N-acetylglutamate synthase-like GNAT family acetyltransferase